ncbi:GTP-binding protein Di-Ras1-like [Hydractinia symbiolongicarpus]|uniref:GTP-binding protein Di-Ras1-like n=1 Tax=Hydractinia symbiolongicarpus TaxID=13093 RepID=UPI00254C0E68|nr:GTP-binding protein Di-Ras1-like [Hydractinia symbiolongicarpus]
MTVRKRLKGFSKNKRSLFKDEEETNYGKIVLLGDAGVGKTSLIDRMANNSFTEHYNPTAITSIVNAKILIGQNDQVNEHYTSRINHNFNILNNKNTAKSSLETTRIKGHKDRYCCFQFVNTNADITHVAPVTYRATVANVKGVILVCAFDKSDSLKHLKEMYNSVHSITGKVDIPVVIAANKCDLKNTKISVDEIMRVAEELGVGYCMISAASSNGCGNLIQLLLNALQSKSETTEDIFYKDKKKDENCVIM